MALPTQVWHPERNRLKRLPRHVGIIPDGNRRWADGHGLERQDGYAAGIMPGLQLLEIGRALGIPEASVYGFTRENTRRSRVQVEAFSRACVDFAAQAVAVGAAVRVFGDTESRVFPDELRALAAERSPGDVRVNLLVNYSWQWDVAAGRAAGTAAPAWAEGLLLATAEGQSYEATVSGNTIEGIYLDSAGGCNDTYDFHAQLDVPLLAPPPFSTVPGYFDFANDQDKSIDLWGNPTGPANLVLRSRDVVDFSPVFPLSLTLRVGETAVWEFVIEESSPPTPAPVGAIWARAPMPENIVDLMFESINKSVLTAQDAANGQLIALYAPHDFDWTLKWLSQTIDSTP